MKKQPKQPKEFKPILINNPQLGIVPNKPLSKNASSKLNTINKIAKHSSPNNSFKTPITIDSIPDKDDPSIIYPIRLQATVPTKYFMQFQSTRQLLFDNNNKISLIDIYLFMFICDNYADYKQFFVAKPFWDNISNDLNNLNLNYSLKALHNSILKLTNAGLIIREAKACYSINKFLIFSGNLNLRQQSIENQFFKY